jgi:hypothetical protein
MPSRETLASLFENLLALGKPLADMLGRLLPELDPHNWWQSCVVAKADKDDVRIINEKGKTSLDELDIAILLKIMIRNWNGLSALHKHKFTAKKMNLVRSVREIRNKTMHLTVKDIADENFGSDFETLKRFAEFIGTDMDYSVEMFYKAHEQEQDAARKDRLYDLLDTKIFMPAINSSLLVEDIKESVKDTQERVKNKNTSKEISDFFYDALVARRGKQVYEALKDAGLLSFEDVIDDFFKTYWGQ